MTTTLLPPPSSLADLPKFSSWYRGQAELFSYVMTWLSDPTQRFLAVNAPTGSGKSLTEMLAARLSGKRTVVLTATKGLQTQLLRDFGHMAKDIRGQNNYDCHYDPDDIRGVEDGPCHVGIPCKLRDNGCTYYDALKLFTHNDIGTTNYAYYLAQTTFSDGLGPRDLLVCDEAHLALNALESFKTHRFGRDELEQCGADFPSGFDEWPQWQMWASRSASLCATRAEELHDIAQTEGRAAQRAYKRAKSLTKRLEDLATAGSDWVWEQHRSSSWQFTPVWPGVFAGQLFRNTPKVLLLSASITPKVCQLLGLPVAPVEFPSTFPAASTPVQHVRTARLNHRTTPDEWMLWVNRIDQIISRRQDRKGIIYPVSYNRRNMLMENSRHRAIMMTHGREDINEGIAAFKRAPPPAVLVSPSITAGWDFPYGECEYIVIGKIPYPDTRSLVTKARSDTDKEWGSFIAMETLVQTAGRGTRAEDDQCEVLILDDNWGWFWPRNRKFAPSWFHNRVRRSRETLPEPLPKLERRA